MSEKHPYPSDLSDARWQLIEPILSQWRADRAAAGLGISQPQHDLRTILNAILYVDRSGISWTYLPHDFPPWPTVYYYFAAWEREGVFEQLSGLLRRLARQQAGRDAEPSAGIIDAQSVKTAPTVPRATQGEDAAKKIVGRKRSIMTDTLGLLLLVLVTAASVQDTPAGIRLLDKAATTHRRLSKIWVDAGYKNAAVDHGARLGIDVEVVHRPAKTRGFTLLPRRWVVEICQPDCTYEGIPVGSWPSFHFNREYQPGGRLRRFRSCVSSSASAWAMKRQGLRLSRRAHSQPRWIQ